MSGGSRIRAQARGNPGGVGRTRCGGPIRARSLPRPPAFCESVPVMLTGPGTVRGVTTAAGTRLAYCALRKTARFHEHCSQVELPRPARAARRRRSIPRARADRPVPRRRVDGARSVAEHAGGLPRRPDRARALARGARGRPRKRASAATSSRSWLRACRPAPVRARPRASSRVSAASSVTSCARARCARIPPPRSRCPRSAVRCRSR